MSSRARGRSVSEPSLQVVSSNFTRERLRRTDLAYEQGKDKLAHWIGAWGHEEVCTLLKHLVARCPFNQMEYLWTVMESVPHRDLLYAVASSEKTTDHKSHSGSILEQGHFRPLSTPASREITARLNKSRYIENKQVHRARSVIMHEGFQQAQPFQKAALNDLHLFESPVAQSESQLLLRPFTPTKLPGLGLGFSSPYPFSKSPVDVHIPRSRMCHNLTYSPVMPDADRSTPSSGTKSRVSPFVSTRILTPMRRHMSPSQHSMGPSMHGSPTRPSMHGSPTRPSMRASPSRWGVRTTSRTPVGQDQRPMCAPAGRGQKGRGGQVTIAEEGKLGDGEIRPATASEISPSTGLERPPTELERPPTELERPPTGLERPPTGLERPPTGLERPLTGLERPLTGFERPLTGLETRATTGMSCLAEMNQMVPLPLELLDFLIWFNDIPSDWQQQELLQMVVWNLDKKELYYLSALLTNRRYRDYVTELPEAVAIQLLSYIPAKMILARCCRVSQGWNSRCSNEMLWKDKVHQGILGLPVKHFLSWKQLYLDDLRLKKNWRKGRCILRTLEGHTNKVVSVGLRGDLLASGSADCTVRVWNVETGECLSVLQGHLGTVWTVRFYGKDLLISGAGDGHIKIWNYRTGVCERTLSCHSDCPVWAIQQKRELLVSGGQDKLVRC